MPNFDELTMQLKLYAQLKAEYGANGVEQPLNDAAKALETCLAKIKELPIDETLALQEPNDLPSIKKLRPQGPRQMRVIDVETYKKRVTGALIGRMAGCTLGAPVEFNPIDRMEKLAEQNGTPFPPEDYWSYVDNPSYLRYRMSRRDAYTRDKMDGVPVDDDVEYTLTGLVVVEKHGLDFTTAACRVGP